MTAKEKLAPESRTEELRKFHQKVINYWDTPRENRQGLKAEIDGIIASQGSRDEQDKFLWDSIRQRIIDASGAALITLDTPPAKDFYLINEGVETLEEYKKLVQTNPKAFRYFCEVIHKIQDGYLGITLDHPDDIQNIPGFTDAAIELPWVYLYESMDEEENKSYRQIVFAQLPYLYPGVVWIFESFKQMAENNYPQKEGADFSKVAEVVYREAIVRAFRHTLLSFDYSGKHFEVDQDKKRKRYQDSFSLQAKIEEGMNLYGNEAALHLLLYQLVKNSVKVLDLPVNEIKDAELEITAKTCWIEGQKLIAFRICDNGPGIDITKILRAKQELLQKSGRELTSKEQMIIGDWTCLDLRIREVIDFIFERRVSGSERSGSHSGIGLALAKEIVEKHGGCIWATNLAGKNGAKFLVILDPTKEGKLRQNLPELFDINKVPTPILVDIDSQLDQYFRS